MDFTGLIFLAFLWFLFNLLGKNRGQRPGQSRPVRRVPLELPGGGDPSQQEGSRLETLFRELERTLNEAANQERQGPRGRPAATPLPSAEEVEERESLEREVEVVSLEQEVRRPERIPVNRDESAEQVEAARVAAAEARSGALTSADHTAFHARLRPEPADATAVRALSAEQLRRAVVWREILGPPVSQREPER